MKAIEPVPIGSLCGKWQVCLEIERIHDEHEDVRPLAWLDVRGLLLSRFVPVPRFYFVVTTSWPLHWPLQTLFHGTLKLVKFTVSLVNPNPD